MALITPPLILTPFANAGDQSVVPATDPNGFVNYNTGYTPDYEINLGSGDPQAKAVERGVQNYLFNALTTGLQAWQTSNRPPWYSSMPGGYAQWAEVVFPNGSGTPVPYRSLVSGNVSSPGSSSTWEYIEGTGELIANVPMPSGGPGGPGSILINTATDFNTLVSNGTFQFQSDSVVAGSPNTPVNGAIQAGAGMLEVMSWQNGATAYTTQFFRDRNGIGFMRGGSGGSWTVWKIWANAHQFTPGEVRMWSGTATEAAVQAAWGPGWHLCNGANGTPDLRNMFVIGAGANYANGVTGGAATATLTLANMPAHNHPIIITDNGHSHGISQTPHAHAVVDNGHAHGVYDPGHAHVTLSSPGLGQGASGANSVQQQSGSQISGVSGTGIQIYPNGTGISVAAGNANVSVNTSGTGITAASQNTGSGTSFAIMPPFYALAYVMYTGA